MAIVKFNHDIYPYCAGDVVNLEKKTKEAVDKTAKSRGIENAYEAVKADTKRSDSKDADAKKAAEAKREAEAAKAAKEAEAKAAKEAEAKKATDAEKAAANK